MLDLLPRSRCHTVSLAARGVRAAGDLGGVLLVVDEGWVAVTTRSAPDGRRTVVAVAGADDVLPAPVDGELLEALHAARVTIVPAHVLTELLANAASAEALAEGLLRAVRNRQASLRSLGHVRHVDRVREKLLQLAAEHGRVVARGVRIDLPLTHELLADMIGSSRETVTVALAELRRRGFVDRAGRHYCVHVAPGELAA